MSHQPPNKLPMNAPTMAAVVMTAALALGASANEPVPRVQWASGVLAQKESELVRYCVSKLPELEQSLAADYGVFNSRLGAAVSSMTNRKYQGRPLMREPDPVVVARVQELMRQSIEAEKLRDAGAMCKDLSIRLTHKTAEAIAADIDRLLLLEFLDASDNGKP